MSLSDLEVKIICKLGQLEKCCRYLAVDEKGFQCLKHTEFKSILDQRVQSNTMHAKADNCEGKRNVK